MDKISAPIKNRILQFINNKGFEKKKFFEELEVSASNFRGTSLKSEVGGDVIAKISSSYPEINLNWLISGKGIMIKEDIGVVQMVTNRKTTDKIHPNQEIPLYDWEAAAGLKELFNNDKPQRVLDTIKIPNLPKCDGAVTVTGDSMYPLLKSGDIILYKEMSFDNLFFGEMYLLSVRIDDWEEYVTVKYIQKSESGNEFIKLVSENRHHQARDIHVSKISALALIKASIRINTMM